MSNKLNNVAKLLTVLRENAGGIVLEDNGTNFALQIDDIVVDAGICSGSHGMEYYYFDVFDSVEEFNDSKI